MSSIQFSDLKEFLSDCIMSIKKSYPNLSSVQIAKKLDLTSSTFSRFENREIMKPSFNHALKIVREACGETRVQDFIKVHYPEMYKSMAKTYPGNVDLEFLPQEAEAYLQDSSTYKLIMMATCNAGLTKDFVISEYGKEGKLTLEKLLAKNILVERNHIITLGPKNINFDQDTAKKLLLNLINSSYSLDAFGTQVNRLTVQYESVNRKKVTPILRDICIEANQKIRKAFNDPENNGCDVMWAGLVMDSLVQEKTEEKIEEKPEIDGVLQ